MEITIVENLQRADLNPMEQARAFERLSRDFHMTQEQMADAHRQGTRQRSQLPAPSQVCPAVQDQVESGDTHLRPRPRLPGSDSRDDVEKTAQKVAALSPLRPPDRDLVQGILNPEESQQKKPSPSLRDPNVREAKDRFSAPSALKSPSKTTRPGQGHH